MHTCFCDLICESRAAHSILIFIFLNRLQFAKLVEATEKLSNDLDLQVFRPLQVCRQTRRAVHALCGRGRKLMLRVRPPVMQSACESFPYVYRHSERPLLHVPAIAGEGVGVLHRLCEEEGELAAGVPGVVSPTLAATAQRVGRSRTRQLAHQLREAAARACLCVILNAPGLNRRCRRMPLRPHSPVSTSATAALTRASRKSTQS